MYWLQVPYSDSGAQPRMSTSKDPTRTTNRGDFSFSPFPTHLSFLPSGRLRAPVSRITPPLPPSSSAVRRKYFMIRYRAAGSKWNSLGTAKKGGGGVWKRGKDMMPYYHMGARSEHTFALDGMLVHLWCVGCSTAALWWEDRVPMGRVTRILIRATLGPSTHT